MTAPALKAPKVLPNYRFLSQGHRGMRSKMDYVPTLTLLCSFFFVPHPPNFLAILCPLLLPFSLLLQVSFSLFLSLFNGLHMSAKWPWHKVKCPAALSHAVPPSALDHKCSAYSTQPQPSANPPVQTTLSRSPIHHRPCQPFVIAACYQ